MTTHLHNGRSFRINSECGEWADGDDINRTPETVDCLPCLYHDDIIEELANYRRQQDNYPSLSLFGQFAEQDAFIAGAEYMLKLLLDKNAGFL